MAFEQTDKCYDVTSFNFFILGKEQIVGQFYVRLVKVVPFCHGMTLVGGAEKER